MEIARAAEAWLRHLGLERGLSANSLAAYRRDVRAWCAFLAGRGIAEPDGVREEDVTAFVRSLGTREPPLAASSTARMLSAVRGLSRWLADEGLAASDPTADVRPPRLPSRLPKAIGVDEVVRLIASVDGDDPLALRDRALLELLYATGARVSEATGLDVDDVADAELVRLTGKGARQRVVPVGSYAREALDAWLVRGRPALAAAARGRRTPPALFLGARGGRLARQAAWEVLRGAAERTGLAARVSPHTLRHSFATHLIAGGADVRVVQELLGHSSVATTQLYTLVTADALRDVYTSAHPRAR